MTQDHFWITQATISEVHEGFKNKKISPLELTEIYLKRLKSDQRNVVLTLCEDRARHQAQEAEKRLHSKADQAFIDQPLLGIPIGLKDIFTLKGVRTTCGSKILENYVPPYTATVIEHLEKAGAIILGKLNLDEFAMGSSNENSAFGPVEHPTHEGVVPGGSSGGSAVAVRSGLCHAALGTDTGGSIRLPAAFCGVTGMKPTYGLVSRYGLVAFASSLDQAGPLARNVQDCARILDVMMGVDLKDSTHAQKKPKDFLKQALTKPHWKGVTLGVPKNILSSAKGLDPEVYANFEEQLEKLKKRGATLLEIDLPHTRFSVAVYYLIAVSEASSNLARFDGIRYGVRPKSAENKAHLKDFYEEVRSLFGSEVKRRILLGTFALSSGYQEAYFKRACQVRRLISQDFNKAFQQVNAIVLPVSPTLAFKKGEKVADPLQMYLNDILTIPVNLAGLPALSIPTGESQSGLSHALQLVGAPYKDAEILSYAGDLIS